MRIAGDKLVYLTIPVRTIDFCTGIKYCRGKTATFPLPNGYLSKDHELLKSWSYERSKKTLALFFKFFNFNLDRSKAVPELSSRSYTEQHCTHVHIVSCLYSPVQLPAPAWPK